MGTSDFGLQSAEAILEKGHSIISVVTVPDKPQGRGLHLLSSPVKGWALAHHLPILQPTNLREPQFITTIQSLAPDIIIVIAFRILPKEIFTLAKRGTFNLHASLLPKYRGAAPIQWALINGEHETGVTTFFLQEKVDTGNIVVQEKITVDDRMTYGELHAQLAKLGTDAVIRTIELIEIGGIIPAIQDDTLGTTAPKITTEICRIDWKKSANEIHNLIRALSPAPGAWTTLHDHSMKIFLSAPSDTSKPDSLPGTCSTDGSVLHVQTGRGTLEIIEAQREGRKRMKAANLIDGRNVKNGDILI